MNKQREKTKQGIKRRVEKSRMGKIERRKEQERTEGTDNNRFWNSRLNKHRKRGERKNRVKFSSCLHDQEDCAGETPQETHVKNRKNRKNRNLQPSKFKIATKALVKIRAFWFNLSMMSLIQYISNKHVVRHEFFRKKKNIVSNVEMVSS